MKKLTIKNAIWNIAMKTIKSTLATDMSRPVLKKCKVEVDEEYIKFISIDGYTGTIYTHKHNQENVEKFDFVIDCFMVDVDKNWVNVITIERDDDCIKFSYVDNNKNYIERTVEKCDWEYINYINIFKNKDSQDVYSVLVDVRKLKQILSSYSGNCRMIRIMVNKDKSKPVFFESGKDMNGAIESILLPIREISD